MKQLVDYIKVFKNIIPEQVCSEIVNNSNKSNNWVTHRWQSYGKPTPSMSPETEPMTSYPEVKKDYDILMESVRHSLLLYLEKLNSSFYDSWNGYSPIRLNKYPKGSMMLQHCDHVNTVFDGTRKGIPTLSIVGSLNNNYDGGEFIMFDDFEIKINTGDILVFPSNFLYPHQVKTVLKGVRHTFVSWVY